MEKKNNEIILYNYNKLGINVLTYGYIYVKILKALNILMKRHFQDIFMIDIQYHKLKCYY